MPLESYTPGKESTGHALVLAPVLPPLLFTHRSTLSFADMLRRVFAVIDIPATVR